MNNKVLVIGATGKVGSELIKLLVERDADVRAASRSPERLGGKPVEAVLFDFERPETFEHALEGVSRVFLIAPPAHPDPERVLTGFLDRTREAGIGHVVFMTAMGVDQDEELGLRKVERFLEGSGLGYTLLRPNWFMQNFSPGFILDGIRHQGGVYLPAGDAKVSFIDARDIAAVAAEALTGDGHAGKAYTLTGGEAIDYGQASRMISEVSGRDIPYVAVSDDDMRDGMLAAGWEPKQVEFMIGLFQVKREGFAAPVSGDVTSVLGRAPIPFQAYARDYADTWR